MKYIVLARVDTILYATKVEAESVFNAERAILDLGICGKHEYGCKTATAYDFKAMKNVRCFHDYLMEAEMVSLSEMKEIIEANNNRIRKLDFKEEKIDALKASIKKMEKELEEAKAELKYNIDEFRAM